MVSSCATCVNCGGIKKRSLLNNKTSHKRIKDDCSVVSCSTCGSDITLTPAPKRNANANGNANAQNCNVYGRRYGYYGNYNYNYNSYHGNGYYHSRHNNNNGNNGNNCVKHQNILNHNIDKENEYLNDKKRLRKSRDKYYGNRCYEDSGAEGESMDTYFMECDSYSSSDSSDSSESDSEVESSYSDSDGGSVSSDGKQKQKQNRKNKKMQGMEKDKDVSDLNDSEYTPNEIESEGSITRGSKEEIKDSSDVEMMVQSEKKVNVMAGKRKKRVNKGGNQGKNEEMKNEDGKEKENSRRQNQGKNVAGKICCHSFCFVLF